MLFPTKQKVERELDRLLTDLEKIDTRLQVYEGQEGIVGSIFGPSPELAEMRAAHGDVHSSLIEATVGIRFGSISFREIAPQLKPVAGAVRHFKNILDQADAASAAGKAAFKERFGS
jgi:hypothetical protein